LLLHIIGKETSLKGKVKYELYEYDVIRFMGGDLDHEGLHQLVKFVVFQIGLVLFSRR
jgi:hypothetical protein